MRDSNTLLIELFPLQNYTIFFTYANFSSKKIIWSKTIINTLKTIINSFLGTNIIKY